MNAMRNCWRVVTVWFLMLLCLGPSNVIAQGQAPVITAQPQGVSVNVGGSATLSITASGTPPLSYQWRFNGIPLFGATNATLTLNNVQTNQSGTYDVMVTNDYGSVLSSSAVLWVGYAPVVTVEPQGQTSVANSPATLRAAMDAFPAPVYQWFNNGVALAAATNTELVVTLGEGSYGQYSVTGSNVFGTVTSRTALIVGVPPCSSHGTAVRSAVFRQVSTLAGLAGSSGSTDAIGNGARFKNPRGVAVDGVGNVYVADTDNHTLRKVTSVGVVSTFAGSAGQFGFINGVGNAAMFYYPEDVAVDNMGNIYVSEPANHTIRKVTPAGVVSTLAGVAGNSGSTDGPGSGARFNYPRGLAVDNTGNVYVADSANQTIRKVTSAGVVSTLAGSVGQMGSADGGITARFRNPFSVAVDNAGNVYVADTSNSTIRKVTPGGIVSTLAGSAGQTGSTDGSGSAARFNYPYGVAVDSAGNVYVADNESHTIRKVSSAGVVSTLAGSTGQRGSTDDIGNAAKFSAPHGVAVDSAGNVYVADLGNHCIRNINAFTVAMQATFPVARMSANRITFQGDPINLFISTDDFTGLTYQWSKNGTLLTGVTQANYVISPAFDVHSGLYRVTVTRGPESVSLQQYVAIAPMVIEASPAAEYVRTGTTLNLTAVGAANLLSIEGISPRFEWLKDGVLIPGSQNLTNLAIPVALTSGGIYSVRWFEGGEANYTPISYRLRPLDATVITNQPLAASVTSPGATNFTVGASGLLLFYQWYFNGTVIVGATNATLSVTNIGAAQAGGYYAVVGNPVSSATSAVAQLTVNFVPSPVFTNTPSSFVARRTGFTLGGSASGTQPISYQWLRNGVAIAGATNTVLSVSAGELTSGNYSYTLRASNPYGTNVVGYTVQVVNGFRTVAGSYWPGRPMAVDVQYGPSATSQNHSYTEQLPSLFVSELTPDAVNTAGLPVGYHLTGRNVRMVATNISENGVWDPVLGTVKWGPFFETMPRTLRYTLVPPLGWTNSITLTGALAEDFTTTANLNSSITLNPAHPADNGPATDQFLNIFEVAAYAAAWRNSRTWHVPPMTIDQTFVTAAGAIWKLGEYYRIVVGTPPTTWQPASLPAGMTATNYAGTFVTDAAASPLGVAVRTTAPVAGATNGALNMTITVTPAASVGVFLMEEQLPPGWTATNISNGGFLDLNFNKLKWGPLFSSAPTVYSYTAVPPAGATGIHAFNGLAGFDGAIINIAGQAEFSLGATPVAPYVLVQPVGSTVGSGASASFGVVVGGTAPLSFQWRKNGIAVSGATNATLTLNNVTSSTKGNYDVVISSPGGSVTSFPATLTVLSVSFNGMMVFGDSISDTGNSPAPAGQYFNGRYSNGSLWEEILAPKIGVTFDPSLNYAVSGTETSDLAAQVARVGTGSGQLCAISSGGNDFINNLGIGVDDFVWSGIINSAVGNITSAISSLHGKGGRSFLVLNLPDMGQLPGTRQTAPALITYAGQKTVQFNTALANALTTLQGQLAGSSIKVADVYGRVNQVMAAPGTFGFTVTSVDALSDGTLADKSFTGPGANYLFWDAIHPTTKGHAQISTAAEVALGIFGSTVTAPAITQQPQGVTAVAGSRVILGVGATGTAPLTYQWRRNGAVLTNAVSALLFFTSVQPDQAGNYEATVSNAAGSVNSSVAVVSVLAPPPLITMNPSNRRVVAGSTATLSVAASSGVPLTYQWMRDGLALVNATNGTLTLSNITRAFAGIYAVGVSNNGGGVISSNAFLQVMVPQRFQPPMRLGDGRVRLIFGDQDGFALRASDATNFFLYASPGLGKQASWRAVTNSLVLTNGMFMVEDTAAIGAMRRFYMVIDGDQLIFIDDPTNPGDTTVTNPTDSGNNN